MPREEAANGEARGGGCMASAFSLPLDDKQMAEDGAEAPIPMSFGGYAVCSDGYLDTGECRTDAGLLLLLLLLLLVLPPFVFLFTESKGGGTIQNPLPRRRWQQERRVCGSLPAVGEVGGHSGEGTLVAWLCYATPCYAMAHHAVPSVIATATASCYTTA